MIDNLFNKIDTVGQNFVVAGYEALSIVIQTPLRASLVLYFTYLGYMASTGRLNLGTWDIVVKVGRAFLIYALLTGWGDLTGYAYDLFDKTPQKIANIVASSTGVGDASENFVANKLSYIYDTIIDLTTNIWNQSPTLSAVLFGLICVVVLLVGIIFIAAASGIIIAAKMTMWLVFASAPIFILCMMFDRTIKYFEGWLNYVFQIATTVTFAYVFLAFYIHVIDSTIASINLATISFDIVLPHIGALLLTMIIGTYVMLEVPSIAAAITGGMAMNAGTSAANKVIIQSRNARNLAWRGAKNAARNTRTAARNMALKSAEKATARAQQATSKKNLE